MRLRHFIKYYTGAFFSGTFPKRSHTVKQEFTLPAASSLPKGIINRSIRYYCACKLNADNAESTHKEFWQNQTSSQWFDRTSHRLEELYIPAYQKYVKRVNSLLAQYGLVNICEWGAGNGSWLNYLQGQLTGVKNFAGVDLSDSQINANQQEYPELTFHQGDIVEWTGSNIQAGTLYHTNTGVLEYLSQASLTELFSTVISKSNTGLFLMEPVEKNHDLLTQKHSFLHGDEYSYSHNLPHLINDAGFEIIFLEEATVLNYRVLIIFAVNK
ncbi:class I SAM-dependent methyltransferase [bacterium]|nr:class I SAM-dependent methyltransferase [bacterium]